jgi:hypothetical protein
MEGLKKTKAYEKKQLYEAEYNQRLNDHHLKQNMVEF